MSTTIHIGTVNIASEYAGSVASEIERGASPEMLRDLGESVPEGAESTYLQPELPFREDEDQLEAMKRRFDQEGIDANSRATYLMQAIKDTGSQRRMQGFAQNHERTPNDREAVEAINYVKQQDGKESLQRACGVCALAKTCSIRGKYDQWVATHPYSTKEGKLPYSSVSYPDIKTTEPRMKFVKRLQADPLAHCIPGKKPAQKAA